MTALCNVPSTRVTEKTQKMLRSLLTRANSQCRLNSVSTGRHAKKSGETSKEGWRGTDNITKRHMHGSTSGCTVLTEVHANTLSMPRQVGAS